MPRRNRLPEQENHERWLVSYADFITLLFAFFVVMYSISSVNEGKYKVLSKTLVAAFTGQPERPHPVQPVDGAEGPPRLVQLPALPVVGLSAQARLAHEQLRQQLAQVASALANRLAEQVRQGQVQVRLTPQGVVIDIHDNVLFASGSASLGEPARAVLSQVSQVLAPLPYQFRVDGYTDDQPIHNAQFDSNWDLSVTRSLSVLHELVAQGVAPEQLAAAGFGQYHPLASNATPDGRAANRRVSIVVVSPEQPTGAERGAVVLPAASATARGTHAPGQLPS